MKTRWGLFLTIAASILMTSMAIVKILQGSLINYIQVFIMALPAVFALVLAMRKNWLGIVLASLVVSLVIPVPLLDRFGFAFYALTPIILVYLAETAMHHTPKTIVLPAMKMMLALALVTTIRIAWDRPGSAQMGESGGLNFALNTLTGMWGFLAISMVVYRCPDWKRQARLATIIVLIGWLHSFVASLGANFYIGWLYHRPVWMLAAFALPWVLTSEKLNRSDIPWFYLFVGLLLLLAAVSGHRSRPIFALGSTMVVLWCYRKSLKPILFMGGLGVFSLIMLANMGVLHLPASAARAVSIFMPAAALDKMNLEAGITAGWEDDFRETVWQVAREEIGKRPLFGSGYAFSRSALINAFSSVSSADARYEGHAIVGGVHNMILDFAMRNGIPLTLLLILAYLSTLIRFLKWVRPLEPGKDKFFGVFLLAYLLPQTGQFLVNAGERDLVAVCITLGIMNGILLRHAHDAALETPEEKAPRAAIPMARMSAYRR